MRIGAHISVAGGIINAISKAKETGAECLQLFASPPQNWFLSKIEDFQCQQFRLKAQDNDVWPVFIHSTYLINLATQNPAHLDRSKQALYDDLKIGEKIGAAGVIFHLGSHHGRGLEQVLDQIASSLIEVLATSKTQKVALILENSAGAGGTIGAKFADLGNIIKAAKSKRVKICLDTQHSFAAGYPIHQKDGLDNTLKEIDREVGIENLAVIHANDSKVPFLTGRDRHENIGQGYIGTDGFEVILESSALAPLPFIIETPGFDQMGPDKKNIDILRSLVKSEQ